MNTQNIFSALKFRTENNFQTTQKQYIFFIAEYTHFHKQSRDFCFKMRQQSYHMNKKVQRHNTQKQMFVEKEKTYHAGQCKGIRITYLHVHYSQVKQAMLPRTTRRLLLCGMSECMCGWVVSMSGKRPERLYIQRACAIQSSKRRNEACSVLCAEAGV